MRANHDAVHISQGKRLSAWQRQYASKSRCCTHITGGRAVCLTMPVCEQIISLKTICEQCGFNFKQLKYNTYTICCCNTVPHVKDVGKTHCSILLTHSHSNVAKNGHDDFGNILLKTL